MKKTFPANIDGQIFYIDEDAFNLLNNYLEQLRMSFRGDEGEEIVSDIESRIRELLDARMNGGKCVIVLSDVNNVIETLGRPEDISDGQPGPENGAPEGDTAGEEQESKEDDSAEKSEENEKKPFFSINMPTRKKLFRSNDNKVFGGVFGGLGYFLGWNANIMRLFYVIIALCTEVWPLTIIYLICWMIIPMARTPKQILEMRGEPLNLSSVGQAVMETTATPPPYRDDTNFFTTIFNIIGKSLMALLGGICAIVGICCLMGVIFIAIGLVAYQIGTIPAFMADVPWGEVAAYHNMIAVVVAILMVITLAFGLAWGAFAVITNSKGPKPAFGWAMLAIFVILLVVFFTYIIRI